MFALLASLLAPFPAHADQIRSLNRGDQSLSAYYGVISAAKTSIDIATFQIEPCQSSAKFLIAELVARAKQGVKVRIVVEKWPMKEPTMSGLPAYLKAQSKNIELRYFGTQSLLALDGTRLHAKLLVADGNTIVMGGRNLTDEYFGLHDKLNYVDQDLLIVGRAAKQAQGPFKELWDRATAPTVQGDGKAWAASCLAENARDQAVFQHIRSNSASLLAQRPLRSCGTLFAMDHPILASNGDNLDGETLSFKKRATGLVLDFLDGVQTKLVMNNQYYMPWFNFGDKLKQMREVEKKSIEVFSNATGDIYDLPEHNRAFTCYIQSSGYQSFKGSQKVTLLTSKGQLRDPWALSPGSAKWRIHSKTFTRDDKDVVVSSWNIDPRSHSTNVESAVYVQGCPGLAKDLNEQYQQLRDIQKKDAENPACRAEFNKTYLSDTVRCGGMPGLY